ncbi:hypothetical protein CVV38_00280 [Candidatus Peregrinibacteria bacterium HGW-Peregrinibacteria-1]|jgi:magnesium-transporting ATPase (P-type)|nr:MAG: hypothetical protein CVV38_00280 [Candidatus Peregrinibacteria bacterium HGW-Peregrinibacteria-1]
MITLQLAKQIGFLLIAILPISYFIFKIFDYITGRSAVKMSKTNVICTNITGSFTAKDRIVKTLNFETFTIERPDNKDFLKLVNLTNNEELFIKEQSLKNTPELQKIAIPTYFCRYPKTHELEKIIIEFLQKAQFNKDEIEDQYEILEKVTPQNDSKISTVVLQDRRTKEIFAFSKGNPKEILAQCNRVLENEKNKKLTASKKRTLTQKFKRLNQSGQKLIAYSFRPLPLKKQSKYTSAFTEKDMVFTGTIGLIEPLLEIPENTINIAQALNIKTYVISHKREREAVGISKTIGLINPKYYEAITGPYLQKLNDKKLKKMLRNKEKDYVFCELTPADKITVIDTLKQMGNKVTTATDGKHSFSSIIGTIHRGKTIKAKNKLLLSHIIPITLAKIILLATAIIFLDTTNIFTPETVTTLITINLITLFLIRIHTNTKDLPKKISPAILKGLLLGTFIVATTFLLLTYHGWTINASTTTLENTLNQKIITGIFITLAIYQLANTIALTKYGKLTRKASLLQKILTFGIIAALAITIIARHKDNLAIMQGIEIQLLIFTIISVITIQQIAKFLTGIKHATPTN